MKKLIYNLILVMWLAVMAISCNDDDNPGAVPQLYLKKIASDGLPLLELTYDTEERLSRADIYSEGELTHYVLYSYNTQGIQELLRYNDEHKLVIRSVFVLDDADRIIKSEHYTAFSDFKTVSATYTFTYDPAGRVKARMYSTAYDPNYTLEEFTYDAANNPINRHIITYPDQPEEYTSSETDFTPGDKPIPAHWTNDILLLGSSMNALDIDVLEMFNIAVHQTSYTKDGDVKAEHSTEATDHQFDSNGYLIRQFLTRRNLFENEPDVVNEMTYEYTE